MHTQQLQLQNNQWITKQTSVNFDAPTSQLCLVFGSGDLISNPSNFESIREKYPQACIVSCSTAGEIIGDEVFDNTLIATAIQFNKTSTRCIKTNINEQANSFETGKYLFNTLDSEDLTGLFIISDGTKINGSELVNGLNVNNQKLIPITGGLAGDAARFTKTVVGLNEVASEGNIVAIGFYGHHLNIGHSSLGGWDEFGKERIITKSVKNVLHEIDGTVALDLYKEYLGPYAEELPGSALLFPLSMRLENSERNLVRTILSVNETDKTMTFAGNLPEGSKVRFMKANFEKLITASATAAEKSFDKSSHVPELAILISCVGRKIILQERTEDELIAAKQVFGDHTCITGFYSYGEISPFNPQTNCELHNQTMTITTFSE